MARRWRTSRWRGHHETARRIGVKFFMLLRLLIVFSCALAFSPTPRRRRTPVRRRAPRPQRVGATMRPAGGLSALTRASQRALVAVDACARALPRALKRRRAAARFGGARRSRRRVRGRGRAAHRWLYAIQALRNAITANTFLASTVLSLFTVTTGYLRAVLQQGFDAVVVVQFSGLLALLLCSAYNFSQAARLDARGLHVPRRGARGQRARGAHARVGRGDHGQGVELPVGGARTHARVAWILGGNTAAAVVAVSPRRSSSRAGSADDRARRASDEARSAPIKLCAGKRRPRARVVSAGGAFVLLEIALLASLLEPRLQDLELRLLPGALQLGAAER